MTTAPETGGRWVMGIDSGGSKSIGVLLREDGYLGGIGFGGPANLYFTSEEDAQTAIRRVVTQAVEMARKRGLLPSPGQSAEPGGPAGGPAPLEVGALYFSSPGLRMEPAVEALRDLIRCGRIVLEDDAPAAFWGALAGGEGVVVLAGTGSFGYGRRGEKTAVKGGWGPLLGDEGSGYWIGVRALQAVIRSYEGRGPATALTKLLRETLPYRLETELRRIVYGPDFTRHRLAGLAMLVSEAAAGGDEVAAGILAAAGRELAQLAVAVATELGWERDDPFPFSLTGGVSNAGPWLTEAFFATVQESFPAARWRPPRYAPCVGAGLRALQLLGVEITPALLNELETSLAEGHPAFARMLQPGDGDRTNTGETREVQRRVAG